MPRGLVVPDSDMGLGHALAEHRTTRKRCLSGPNTLCAKLAGFLSSRAIVLHNATGINVLTTALEAKRIGLVHDLVHGRKDRTLQGACRAVLDRAAKKSPAGAVPRCGTSMAD